MKIMSWDSESLTLNHKDTVHLRRGDFVEFRDKKTKKLIVKISYDKDTVVHFKELKEGE